MYVRYGLPRPAVVGRDAPPGPRRLAPAPRQHRMAQFGHLEPLAHASTWAVERLLYSRHRTAAR